MNITRVVVRPVEMDKVKAMVSVTFDDSFVVHGLRVVAGEKGLFVAMPSRRLPNGEYRDVAHPINTETREMIQTAVLKEYEQTQEEAKRGREEEAKTESTTEGVETTPPVGEPVGEPQVERPDEEVEAEEETPAEEPKKVEETESKDVTGEEQLGAEEKKE